MIPVRVWFMLRVGRVWSLLPQPGESEPDRALSLRLIWLVSLLLSASFLLSLSILVLSYLYIYIVRNQGTSCQKYSMHASNGPASWCQRKSPSWKMEHCGMNSAKSNSVVWFIHRLSIANPNQFHSLYTRTYPVFPGVSHVLRFQCACFSPFSSNSSWRSWRIGGISNKLINEDR